VNMVRSIKSEASLQLKSLRSQLMPRVVIRHADVAGRLGIRLILCLSLCFALGACESEIEPDTSHATSDSSVTGTATDSSAMTTRASDPSLQPTAPTHYRDGRNLIIPLVSGDSVVYVDSVRRDSFEPDLSAMFHRYMAYEPTIHQHIVLATWYEGGSHVLVDGRSGKETVIPSRPVISPDSKYFVTTGSGFAYEPNEIAVYVVGQDGPTLQWLHYPAGTPYPVRTHWGPGRPLWTGNDLIKIPTHPWEGAPPNDTLVLQMGDSGWYATLGDSVIQLSPTDSAEFAHLTSTTQEVLSHKVERAVDLTGDGIPDTIRIQASGPTADGLDIELTINSLGREVYRDEWESGMFFVVLDYIPEGQQRRVPTMDDARRILNRIVYDPYAVERLDEWQRTPYVSPTRNIAFHVTYDSLITAWLHANVDTNRVRRRADSEARYLSQDTTIAAPYWQDMIANTEYVFTYSAHIEYRITVAWCQIAGRFLVIDRCC